MSSRNQLEKISLITLINSLAKSVKFLVSKWKSIFTAGFVGAAFGLFLSWYIPVSYVSKMKFVIEESGGGMGGLASLAGQFGFDINSSVKGGLFTGDNVLLFLKSEQLCRETLMTPYDSKMSLADRYAEVKQWKEKWKKKKSIGPVDFSKFKDGNFPRLEDSLMQVIVKEIVERDLTVAKPDKKASFIEVQSIMRDEMLSKLFSERLVSIATAKYLQSKTKIKQLNILRLQRRADSLSALLDDKSFNAAASQQELVDANPAIRTAPLNAEIATRNKTIVATIFGEVVKNLELSKTMLNQETPVIEMVDRSSLPLEKTGLKKIIGILAGGLISAFVFVIFLLIRKFMNEILTSN
jgi:hypothetical protein